MCCVLFQSERKPEFISYLNMPPMTMRNRPHRPTCWRVFFLFFYKDVWCCFSETCHLDEACGSRGEMILMLGEEVWKSDHENPENDRIEPTETWRDQRHQANMDSLNSRQEMNSCRKTRVRQLMLKMSTKILLLGLFLLAVCPYIHSSAAHYPTGKNRPCCLDVTMKNMSSKINGSVFYNQPARFPCVKAVIFNTNSGPICVHPKATWVQEVIARFKETEWSFPPVKRFPASLKSLWKIRKLVAK